MVKVLPEKQKQALQALFSLEISNLYGFDFEESKP